LPVAGQKFQRYLEKYFEFFRGVSKLLFTYSAIPSGTSNYGLRNPVGEALV
jgi:hypothetical protein